MLKIYKKREGKVVKHIVSDINLEQHYHVVVAGLGTAGSMAAIRAARCGLSVLGLESENFMGGQSTGGGVCVYYLGASGGLFEEIDDTARRIEKSGFVTINEPYTEEGLNPDVKKYVIEQTALKEGVSIVYEAFVIGVIVKEKKVIGVQWIGNGKVHNTGADIVIDATAEGYLFEMMNCKMHEGRRIDNQYQPFSNVIITMQRDKINCRYNDCGHIDPYNAVDISEKLIESNNYPLYNRSEYTKEDRIVSFSRLIGCREGKRIVGKKVICMEQLLTGEKEENVLFSGYANVDVHGKDMAFESEIFQHWVVVCGLWGIRVRIPVPAETCLPAEYDGIIAAGRHISMDHDIASALRMKRDMHKCGEAAGALAVSIIRNKGSISKDTIHETRKILEESGCLKKDSAEKQSAFFDENGTELFLIFECESIKESLAGEKAGWGIWSSIQLEEKKIVPYLLEWIKEEKYCANSALALGLRGRVEAIPPLRKLARDRDMSIFKNSTMYNQPRCIAAIYLLGELKDVGSIPFLEKILGSPDFCKDIEINRNEFIEDHDDLYFQFYSYSLMALLKIGQHYKEKREEIRKVILKSLENEENHICLNLKDGNLLKQDMKKQLRRNAEVYFNDWKIKE